MRKLLGTGALLVALTGCDAIHAIDWLRPAGRTDPPTWNIDAACTTLTVTISGYAPGTEVILGIGADPPYGWKLNGPYKETFPVNHYGERSMGWSLLIGGGPVEIGVTPEC